MKRTNIYLSDVQAKRLQAVAKRLGLSVSEVIRRIIDESLDKYEEKRR